MADILVLANETIGGEKLLDAIRERNAQGDARFHVVVPADAAAPRQRDLRRGRARLGAGPRRPRARVHARGGHRGRRRGRRRATRSTPRWTPSREHGIDEIIVSTLPADVARAGCGATSSSALEEATGLPVEHVVVDLGERGPAVRRDARGRQPDRGRPRARRAPQGARRGGPAAASSSSSRRTTATGRAVREARERLGDAARLARRGGHRGRRA